MFYVHSYRYTRDGQVVHTKHMKPGDLKALRLLVILCFVMCFTTAVGMFFTAWLRSATAPWESTFLTFVGSGLGYMAYRQVWGDKKH